MVSARQQGGGVNNLHRMRERSVYLFNIPGSCEIKHTPVVKPLICCNYRKGNDDLKDTPCIR